MQRSQRQSLRISTPWQGSQRGRTSRKREAQEAGEGGGAEECDRSFEREAKSIELRFRSKALKSKAKPAGIMHHGGSDAGVLEGVP